MRAETRLRAGFLIFKDREIDLPCQAAVYHKLWVRTIGGLELKSAYKWAQSFPYIWTLYCFNLRQNFLEVSVLAEEELEERRGPASETTG